MSRLTKLLLLLIALVATACASDQRPPVAPSTFDAAAAAPRVAPEIEQWFRGTTPATGLRLIPGDRIAISVQGKDELGVTRAVPADGNIPLYRADRSVNALGRTPQELEADIRAAYEPTITNPYVTVTLEVPAPRSVYCMGAVSSPGQFQVNGAERLTVLQVIALAGGDTEEADLRSVTVRRFHPPTGVMVSSPLLDIAQAMERGDEKDNLVVEPGDTIVVPHATEQRVMVLGHVKTPGSVRWFRGMTLSRAIAESGGFMRFAKIEAIRVVRSGQADIVFDFEEMLDGKAPDLPLEPRDVVYVLEKWI